jgi:isopenicillin-N epimerase
VDGVHGLGVDDLSVAGLGCDFFVAGCHKWLFGPRGTGLVWGKRDAWPAASPTIPTFDSRALGEWLDAPSYEHWWTNYAAVYDRMPMAAAMTPGGFHSFEHRWALDRAFRFHQEIGTSNVAERIHGLNRRLKVGLAEMSHVRLHTPIEDELSSGIVCFEVDGLSPTEVVERLAERGIIASESPYHTSYARLAPSLLTSSEDVGGPVPRGVMRAMEAATKSMAA